MVEAPSGRGVDAGTDPRARRLDAAEGGVRAGERRRCLGIAVGAFLARSAAVAVAPCARGRPAPGPRLGAGVRGSRGGRRRRRGAGGRGREGRRGAEGDDGDAVGAAQGGAETGVARGVLCCVVVLSFARSRRRLVRLDLTPPRRFARRRRVRGIRAPSPAASTSTP